MSKYLELPWSVDDTIENLKELKEGLQERCIIRNLHGRGEKDAEEIAFDFDRAIKALEEIQQYRAIGLTPQMVLDLIKSEKQAHKIALENADKLDAYSAIGTVEECRKNKDFLEFLCNIINPNDMEHYLSMYHGLNEKSK